MALKKLIRADKLCQTYLEKENHLLAMERLIIDTESKHLLKETLIN